MNEDFTHDPTWLYCMTSKNQHTSMSLQGSVILVLALAGDCDVCFYKPQRQSFRLLKSSAFRLSFCHYNTLNKEPLYLSLILQYQPITIHVYQNCVFRLYFCYIHVFPWYSAKISIKCDTHLTCKYFIIFLYSINGH